MPEKFINTRVSEALYDAIQERLQLDDVTLAAFLREAVSHYLRCGNPNENGQTQIDYRAITEQLQIKDGQLDAKDDQISELHQLLAMKEKNLGAIGDQLQETRLALESATKRRSWWEKLTGK